MLIRVAFLKFTFFKLRSSEKSLESHFYSQLHTFPCLLFATGSRITTTKIDLMTLVCLKTQIQRSTQAHAHTSTFKLSEKSWQWQCMRLNSICESSGAMVLLHFQAIVHSIKLSKQYDQTVTTAKNSIERKRRCCSSEKPFSAFILTCFMIDWKYWRYFCYSCRIQKPICLHLWFILAFCNLIHNSIHINTNVSFTFFSRV